jgi:hypothetical protein
MWTGWRAVDQTWYIASLYGNLAIQLGTTFVSNRVKFKIKVLNITLTVETQSNCFSNLIVIYQT